MEIILTKKTLKFKEYKMNYVSDDRLLEIAKILNIEIDEDTNDSVIYSEIISRKLLKNRNIVVVEKVSKVT